MTLTNPRGTLWKKAHFCAPFSSRARGGSRCRECLSKTSIEAGGGVFSPPTRVFTLGTSCSPSAWLGKAPNRELVAKGCTHFLSSYKQTAKARGKLGEVDFMARAIALLLTSCY